MTSPLLLTIGSSSNPMRATVTSIVRSDGSERAEANQDRPELLGSLREEESSRSADIGESSSSSTFVNY